MKNALRRFMPKFATQKALFWAGITLLLFGNISCSKPSSVDKPVTPKPVQTYQSAVLNLHQGDSLLTAKTVCSKFINLLYFAYPDGQYRLVKTYTESGKLLYLIFRNDILLSIIIPRPPYMTESDTGFDLCTPDIWPPDVDLSKFVSAASSGINTNLLNFLKDGASNMPGTNTKPHYDYGLTIAAGVVVAAQASNPVYTARQKKWEDYRAKYDPWKLSIGMYRDEVDTILETPLYTDIENGGRQVCYYAPKEYFKQNKVLEFLIVVEFVSNRVAVIRSDDFAFHERFSKKMFGYY